MQELKNENRDQPPKQLQFLLSIKEGETPEQFGKRAGEAAEKTRILKGDGSVGSDAMKNMVGDPSYGSPCRTLGRAIIDFLACVSGGVR